MTAPDYSPLWYWVREREAIRCRRAIGTAKPWTISAGAGMARLPAAVGAASDHPCEEDGSMTAACAAICRLRRARKALGLPKRTVAALMGWSVEYWHVISRWENGRRIPTAANLAKWRLAIARERMRRR